MVEAGVPSDPEKPGLKLPVGFQTRQAHKHLVEDGLAEILYCLSVAHACEYKASHTRLVAFDQGFHSRGVTFFCLDYQASDRILLVGRALTICTLHQNAAVAHPRTCTKRPHTFGRLPGENFEAANGPLHRGVEDYAVERQVTG